MRKSKYDGWVEIDWRISKRKILIDFNIEFSIAQFHNWNDVIEIILWLSSWFSVFLVFLLFYHNDNAILQAVFAFDCYLEKWKWHDGCKWYKLGTTTTFFIYLCHQYIDYIDISNWKKCPFWPFWYVCVLVVEIGKNIHFFGMSFFLSKKKTSISILC